MPPVGSPGGLFRYVCETEYVKRPGVVADATTWPAISVIVMGSDPSPQLIVTVCGSTVPGSVNWPFRATVSPSVAVVSDRLRSAAVICGATLLTVTLANAWPTSLFPAVDTVALMR